MIESLTYTQMSMVLLFEEIGLHLSKPLRKLLSWLIIILLEQTRAHLFRMADKLPDDDSSDMARRQRIRRFLSNSRICVCLVLPPLLQLLRPLLAGLPELVITLDRTSWVKQKTPVNIISAGIYLENRAIPLYWMVWNQLGNSTFEKQKQVLAPVLDALGSMPQLRHIPIHVVGDREFASPKLAEWIWHNYHIHCTLRMKRSLYLQEENFPATKLKNLCKTLKRGEKRILRNQYITKNSTFLMNVAIIWKPQYDEPLIVMTTINSLKMAVNIYACRFGTEPMYKDCKTNIFDIEGTRVTKPERIERLLIPIAFALTLGILEGKRKEKEQETICAHKKQRTTGLAWIGIRAFSRAFRAMTLERFQAFLQQLFSYYRFFWIEKLIPI